MINKHLMLLCIALIIIASPLYAQIAFQKWYGGPDFEEGRSVIQNTDGGYIITGYTMSFGNGGDLYVIRTDSLGDTLWTKTYGGPGFDIGLSVIRTYDGMFAISGTTNSPDGNVYLIKINSNGDTLWTRTYGGGGHESGYALVQTADSGYIIAGATNSYGAGDYDVYVIRTDTNGDTLWTMTCGGANVDHGFSICRTAGGYAIAGETDPSGSGYNDYYLIKINENGDTLWTKTWGGPQWDFCTCMRPTMDGGFILGGNTTSYGTGIYLIKTNGSGDTLWTKVYDETNDIGAWDIAQKPDSGFIIAGNTSPSSSSNDVYLIRTNPIGDIIWTRTYGRADIYDDAASVALTSDGGYAVAGCSGEYYLDVYLIKTDSLGIAAVDEQNAGIRPAVPDLRISVQPNPFITQVNICLGQRANSRGLQIYDATGRLVRSFTLDPMPSALCWNGTDQEGRSVPKGVYFVRLEAGGKAMTEKIIKTQ